MILLETEHEKKSFAISSAITIILLLLFFFFGLTYLDPPPENGIAINFGTSETGSGTILPTEPIQSAPQPSVNATTTASEEDVLSQDNDEAVVIKKSPKPTPVKENAKEEVKPKPAIPQPSKAASDALSSILNGPKSEGTAQGGEGDDDLPGDKGSQNGNPYATTYFGSGGGSGGGKGWGLNGRKLSNTGKEVQKCNETGTVVVQISVNRNGNVVTANYSKGTTNTNPCLVQPAIATAKKYKWQPDPNAPEIQIGFIVVNFRLGE